MHQKKRKIIIYFKQFLINILNNKNYFYFGSYLSINKMKNIFSSYLQENYFFSSEKNFYFNFANYYKFKFKSYYYYSEINLKIKLLHY